MPFVKGEGLDVSKALITIDLGKLKKKKANWTKDNFTEVDPKCLVHRPDELLQRLFKVDLEMLIKYVEFDLEQMTSFIDPDFKLITITSYSEKEKILSFTYEHPENTDELLEDSLHITKICDLMSRNENLDEKMRSELLENPIKDLLASFTRPTEFTAPEPKGDLIPDSTSDMDVEPTEPQSPGKPAHEKMNLEEKKIGSQVTYYFGDKNYFKDKFILNHVGQSAQKTMPTKYLMNFRLIKNISEDFEMVKSSLVKFEKDPMCTYELFDGGELIKKKSVIVKE